MAGGHLQLLENEANGDLIVFLLKMIACSRPAASLGNLYLGFAKVTDARLAPLEGLTNLESLVLGRTKVTEAGVAELKKALPNCKITK